MSKKAVIGIVENYEQAQHTIRDLRAANFTDDDMSVLFPDKSGTRDFAHEQGTKAPEGAIAGVGAGGAVGGTLGLLAGLGLLAIPGLGPFIAAGPILAALSGMAAGAAVGGITGTLVGLGIPEVQAKQYENKVKGGNILMSVHADTTERKDRAKAILAQNHASDICVAAEATA